MIRKEKAYIWVTYEVSKGEESVIRLCLGNQVNSFIFSALHLRHLRELKCWVGNWVHEEGTGKKLWAEGINCGAFSIKMSFSKATEWLRSPKERVG